jgi:hypothetical protein
MPVSAACLLFICAAAGILVLPWAISNAEARVLTSQVTQLDQIPVMRPEYPVPKDPNMLYYIQRSVNSNTVVYAAHVDARGHIDSRAPVDAYWRWYNVDGHRKPLNLIERIMAYGVQSVANNGSVGTFAFKVAGFPERELLLDQDSYGHPEAVAQLGGRRARLIYVYLQVDNRGLLPSVTAMDLFGIDKNTGKALREHVIPQ